MSNKCIHCGVPVPSPLHSQHGACEASLRCDCGIAASQLNRTLCTGPAKLLFIHVSIALIAKLLRIHLLSVCQHTTNQGILSPSPGATDAVACLEAVPSEQQWECFEGRVFQQLPTPLDYNFPLPTVGCTSNFQVVILQIPLASEECVPDTIVRVLGAVKVCQYSFSYSQRANIIQNCLHAFQYYIIYLRVVPAFLPDAPFSSFIHPALCCCPPAQLCARAELSLEALAP